MMEPVYAPGRQTFVEQDKRSGAPCCFHDGRTAIAATLLVGGHHLAGAVSAAAACRKYRGSVQLEARKRTSLDLVTSLDHESMRVVATKDRVSFNRPCLLYTSPSPRDGLLSRMPSSA